MHQAPIKCMEISLPSIEENLALDEALLLAAELGEGGPVLRFWEMTRPTVVVGMNSKLSDEVWLETCRRDNVRVARRCSGGGSVVLASGCLVFSLVLPINSSGTLDVRSSIYEVLGCLVARLSARGLNVSSAGISDLVLDDRKCSGNSQRRLRRYFLHHGTLLYDFDAELAERYLPLPPRAPAYRQGRAHRDFLTNLPLQRSELLECLREAFAASGRRLDWPQARTEQLVREKYGRREWLLRR